MKTKNIIFLISSNNIFLKNPKTHYDEMFIILKNGLGGI